MQVGKEGVSTSDMGCEWMGEGNVMTIVSIVVLVDCYCRGSVM
jgi:hypothetical protein